MRTIFENDIDKTSKAVTKFLRQTQDGEISWKVDSRELFLGADEHLTGQIYMTFILDKYLRIYKYYRPKKEIYLASDTYLEGIKLQITDANGKPEWDFPYSNAVKDLYDTVAFSTTNVQEFLDKWLNE
jgi:hypothetical protein